MSSDISIHDDAWLNLAELPERTRRAIEATLAEVNLAEATVSISFVSDSTIAALNRQWRGKAKPTNVLSFPAVDSVGASPRFLGDVILASNIIRQEAAEQNKSWIDHTTHLIIHGIMHLIGHDHENDEDAAKMEALEVRIMVQLGLANPYDIE